jgi:hypothetical protein
MVTAAALVIAAAVPAGAHDLSRSEARLDVERRAIRATLTLNLPDLHGLPEVDVNGDGRVSYAELDEAIERIYGAIRANYHVRSAVLPIDTTVERYELIGDATLRLTIVYRFDRDVAAVDVASTLFRVTQSDHKHLVTIVRGGDVQEAILDVAHPRVVVEAHQPPGRWRTMLAFVHLGVEHIFTGVDHLAFLLGLLLATGTFRALVKTVTSFTLAHSLTLALATFDVVVLPSRLTESLIALSIVYVALENLLRPAVLDRSRITFFFGLVHGFGFATVLRDMQLPRASAILSLFSFNAGVEIGQLTFIAIAFPCVGAFAASRWRARVRPIASATVACLAVYWFVQRAFYN